MNSDWPRPLTQFPWRSELPVPVSSRLSPLKPNMMPTTSPRRTLGGTGAAAGVVPSVMTSGLYTVIRPVRGLMMSAST